MNNKNPVGKPKKWKEQTELKRFHQYLALIAFPEEYDYSPSASDNFWLSQDNQSDEATEYVKELENKIRVAIIDLKFIYDLAKQTEQTYYENKINSIINKLK